MFKSFASVQMDKAAFPQINKLVSVIIEHFPAILV